MAKDGGHFSMAGIKVRWKWRGGSWNSKMDRGYKGF